MVQPVRIGPGRRGHSDRRPPHLAEGRRDPGRPDVRTDSDPRAARHGKRDACASGLGSGSVADKIYAHEREEVEKERARRPVIPCEVQAIRIGDLGIVTNGAEFFCQLGLDIKAASPLRSDLGGEPGQPVDRLRRDRRRPTTPAATSRAPPAAPRWPPGPGNRWSKASLAALKSHQQGAGVLDLRSRVDTVSESPPIHSSAARMALARVGHGIASQFGSPPWGARHVLDPLLDHLRRLADVAARCDHTVAQRLREDHGVVGERVVGLLLAELADVVVELSCRAWPDRRRRTGGTRPDSPEACAAGAAGSGSWP